MSSEITDEVEKPLLFISHKHDDARIASVLESFVRVRSGGRVEVHQSSSAAARGPRIGRNLNQELLDALWRAGAVVLLYTSSDQDWEYCMWECGVATVPSSPATRVIVFQCGAGSPSVFADQVRIDPRKYADVHKFTKELLTGRFFPGSRAPITGFPADGPEVAEAAQELFARLNEKGILPPPDTEGVEEWPAWGFVQLELSYSHGQRIANAPRAERLAVTLDVLENECLVRECDTEALQIFGMARIPRGTKFGLLINTWREGTVTPASKWLEALAQQVERAAQWRWPEPVWELMRGVEGETWYAPVLSWAKRIPAKEIMLFDIYFQEFRMDAGRHPVLNVPQEENGTG